MYWILKFGTLDPYYGFKFLQNFHLSKKNSTKFPKISSLHSTFKPTKFRFFFINFSLLKYIRLFRILYCPFIKIWTFFFCFSWNGNSTSPIWMIYFWFLFHSHICMNHAISMQCVDQGGVVAVFWKRIWMVGSVELTWKRLITGNFLSLLDLRFLKFCNLMVEIWTHQRKQMATCQNFWDQRWLVCIQGDISISSLSIMFKHLLTLLLTWWTEDMV